MSFETAADAFIRPPVGPAATPAHAVAAERAAASRQQTAALAAGAAREPGAKSDIETASAEFGFADLLDIVNPLQHLPGISTVYQALTGDEIKAPARILGGALYGGPLGMIASVANAAVAESSGRDIGETALAMVFGDGSATPDELAEAAPPAPAKIEAALQPGAGQVTDAPPQPAVATAAPPLPAAAEASPPADRAEPDPEGPDANPGSAVEGASAAEAGPLLTGKAALNAFLTDLAGLGRSLADAPAPGQASGQQAAAPELSSSAQISGEPVPANLVGLGGRDLRSSAQNAAVAARTPAPPRTSGPQPPPAAPHRNSGTGPQLPGKAALDPTLFANSPVGQDGSAAGAAAAGDFSAQMMRALQKYESMLQDRLPAGDAPR